MEFEDAVRKRRSIRKFSPKLLPEEVVQKALQTALLAPNSSNMQTWEFYWVRSPAKKAKLVEFCFSQSAAKTAAELIVAVARVDHWRRNQQLMIEDLSKNPKTPKGMFHYYEKIVPEMYFQDALNLVAIVKWLKFTFKGIKQPIQRGPITEAERMTVAIKTTALACENLMLSLVDQGYGSCPMEGFDEKRVKKLLGLNRHCHVVMVIGMGEPSPEGVVPPRLRFDQSLFIHQI